MEGYWRVGNQRSAIFELSAPEELPLPRDRLGRREPGDEAIVQVYPVRPPCATAQIHSVGPNRSRDSQLGLLLCLGGAEGPSASCGGGWPSHRGHALIDDDWCR